MSFVIALLAFWLGGSPSWAAAIRHVSIGGDRIVVTADPRIAGVSSILFAPSALAYGAQQRDRHGGSSDDGTSRDGAHMVFDLARPALVGEGGFDAAHPMLTLQLKTATDGDFARAAAEGRPGTLPPFNLSDGVDSTYSVALPVPARVTGLSLPHVDGDPSRPLVVIDPGHGGFDPGAVSPTSGLREKDVTLRIARAVRDELLKSGRVRVALTRDDDRFLVLQERYGIARKLHADLFISIHCDSVGSPSDAATGASVYTLSEVASDKEAARLAARENKADIISGVDLGRANADVSSILIDLTQRETMSASADFARLLGREAQPLVPLRPQFHKFAALIVLKAPDMPSILFETGYISNPKDAAFIDSPEGRQRIAQSIERAVQVNFARRAASSRN